MLKSNISELEAHGDIAILTIDNGPKNLLSLAEFIDHREFSAWFDKHPEISALIITGRGRHFSHGADVIRFGSGLAEEMSEDIENARDLLRTIEGLPIVTAAAINGGCFGGGLEIALSCQFRICSPSSFLGLPEITHGVVPGMGGMERLYNLLGKEKTLKMILSGEILSAKHALDIGLVTAISESKNSLDETIKFVKELIDGKTKTQINAIIETVNLAAQGAFDPSKGKFEKTIAEVLSKRNEEYI